MTNLGWQLTDAPFHAGEQAIQSRLGVRQQIEEQGRRIIRDYLPEQHREFFAKLPYLIVGTVDSSGSPWASILVGQPGFLATPDAQTLEVNSKALIGDPLTTILNLTGAAQVIWQGDEIKRYAGAERLLVFHLDRGYRVTNGLLGRWSAPTFSPYLDGTGSWP